MKMGLTALASTLGITQMTATSFGALLAAFKAALGNYNQARGNEQGAYDLFHAKVADLSSWLQVVRGVLVGYFGNRYTTRWAEAGFVQPSTAIPTKIEDRIALAEKLGQFFTANPNYEVAGLNATAAQATVLLTAANAAEDPLLQAQTAAKSTLDLLVAAETKLITNMRMLIGILKGLLSPADPRWASFGLNIPSTRTTPAAPQNVTLTPSGNTTLVRWDAVALATRYRLRMMVVGVDTQYRLVASGKAPMGVISGLPPGATIMVIVQAVNGDAQGKASEPVTYMVPVIESAHAMATPELVKPVAVPVEEPVLPVVSLPNGNGNGSSNGHGSHAVSRLS